MLGINLAIPVLIKLTAEKAVRLDCAVALGLLKTTGKAPAFFQEIGLRELSADHPDRHWLEAVVYGLQGCADRCSAELLATIFARTDLPGWLRGEAGDKLGLQRLIHDHRSQLYRRTRDAAIRGLDDASIDVQFWSMYVLGSIAPRKGILRSRTTPEVFLGALAKLRKIAETDHRLAPGYWWPMSAEAEDVIVCIEQGHWPEQDAADRWKGNKMRGEMNRD